MLLVTIANIDSTYCAVFDTDNAHEAVNLLTESLIKDHGFFEGNYAYPMKRRDNPPQDQESFYGILLMPGEREELDDHKIEDENTYNIFVELYEFGGIISLS